MLNGINQYFNSVVQSVAIPELGKQVKATNSFVGEFGAFIENDTVSISQEGYFKMQTSNLFSGLDNALGVKPLSLKDQAEIIKIEAEIDKIYGFEPKELNAKELKQEEEIFKKIDALLGYKEPKGLTENELKKEKIINDEIDKIIGDGNSTLSAQQEKKLDGLFDQLDNLYGYEEKELTSEEEKQLDSLFGELDKLYGFDEKKGLTEPELKQLDELEAKLDELLGFNTLLRFTEEEEKQLDKLEKSLDKLLSKQESSGLTAKEEKELEEMLKAIDELYIMADKREAQNDINIWSNFTSNLNNLININSQ